MRPTYTPKATQVILDDRVESALPEYATIVGRAPGLICVEQPPRNADYNWFNADDLRAPMWWFREGALKELQRIAREGPDERYRPGRPQG